MSFDNRSGRQPPRLMITFVGARSRTLKFGHWPTVALFGLIGLLGVWYLGATLYFVFHDEILANLISRQTEMQYAYEDKIATLKTDVDREESRGLLDRHTLETTLHALAERGDKLAARTATLDALVTQGLRSPGARFAPPIAGDDRIPVLSPSVGSSGAADPADATSSSSQGDLRLDHSGDTSSDGLSRFEKRSDLSLDDQSAVITATFDRVEREQSETLDRLRDPMVHAVQRIRQALAATGLPLSRWPGFGEPSDVGGPFVPLSLASGGLGFDETVALLRDAARQQAALDIFVNKVPLRRPLEGALEVTSTFGPRLDPFFGRPAMHTGIDLREDSGDAVEATAAGVVTIAGSEGGYGNMVEIDHGNGLATRYAHLSSIEVVPHQKVPAGFIVGRVGSTGRATGPHLHYETRVNGEPVDPARFLRAGTILFPG